MIIHSPHSSGTKMARIISFVRAHKRVSVIIFSWIFAFCAFVLIRPIGARGPSISYSSPRSSS